MYVQNAIIVLIRSELQAFRIGGLMKSKLIYAEKKPLMYDNKHI